MGEGLWEAQEPYLKVTKHLMRWIEVCDEDIAHLIESKEEEE